MILLAFAADRLVGDPPRFHPVAGFGRVAAALERLVWADSRLRGALYAGALVSAASRVDILPGERTSVASLRAPGLVVVRSLTKLWSLAGYLLAEPELVARLEAQRQPWSVNAGALAALAYCAHDRATPGRVAAEVEAAREQLRAALPFRTWPSAANFLLVEGRLPAVGFALRPCDSFPGLERGFTRIAVRRPGENACLLEALCR